MITYKVNSNSSADNYLDGVLTLIENTNKKILAKLHMFDTKTKNHSTIMAIIPL